MIEPLDDPRRVDPPRVADERAMLEAWLDFHRVTLLLKCEGLDDAGRKARPVSTSKLSLHGLVRHMAEVERNWFQRALRRSRDTPPLYPPSPGAPDEEDPDLVPLDDADWDLDLAVWQAECERSRATASAYDLDALGYAWGHDVSLRWILTHMVEEYARHNGHADLIRELVDGAVGD